MVLDSWIACINQVLPEPHAGLLAGMLFGVKTALSQELKNALQITGTLHIIALSGMNITILTNLFFSTFIRVAPRWISSILTIGVIIIFVWFVGPSPSVVRAAIMGCITLLTTITGYMSVALFTWLFACVGMLIVHPLWIADLSFQLSALASLGMILFGAKKEVVYGAPTKELILLTIKDELATTLSAQVLTIPLIFFVFGRISLIAPIANILIGWTIPIITVLGLFVVLFSWIWIPLGQLIAWVVWVFLEYLIQVVMVMVRVPFASIGQ